MLIRDIESIPDLFQQGAVAIGNFDGVHQGHARIVERLRAMADRLGGRAIVFTFDPSPAALLRPEKAPPPLTTTTRKAELMAALGVDAIIAYPTDLDLLRLTPTEFFNEIVGRRLAARALVEGTNFYFGHDRAGTIDVLRSLAAEANVKLDVVEPLLVDGEPVSSSRIRRLIAAGDIQAANRLLTRPYRLCGDVTRGAGRGASIGFPTANLGDIPTLLPAQGVYAGRATVEYRDGREKIWPAAVNIGPNPTFGEAAWKVEAHLIGCDESLYGQSLAVDFLARLRDIQPFANVQLLQAQLARDVAAAKAM